MQPNPLIDPASEAKIRARRRFGFFFVGLILCIDIVATGIFGGSERMLAAVRSIVLPGMPFLEWHPVYGICGIAAALAAVGAWLRWGMDWLLIAVMIVCVAIALFVMPTHHDASPHHHHTVHASHEFTIVLVVFAMLARLQLLITRLPGSDWVKLRLPEGLFFPALDIARTAALQLLNDHSDTKAHAALADERLYRRARRVSAWARFRFEQPNLDGAHAPLRAARALAGLQSPEENTVWRADAKRSLAGVPDSDPTWVRPLDGMLTALALERSDEMACVQRWRWIFAHRFALRHKRRPGMLHTPSMLSLGTCPAWEHAAATALAYARGWIAEDDWTGLRPRCLGAAASAHTDPATLRLIAAGKLWAELTGDAEALKILSRRTIRDDALACVLDDLDARNLSEQLRSSAA